MQSQDQWRKHGICSIGMRVRCARVVWNDETILLSAFLSNIANHQQMEPYEGIWINNSASHTHIHAQTYTYTQVAAHARMHAHSHNKRARIEFLWLGLCARTQTHEAFSVFWRYQQWNSIQSNDKQTSYLHGTEECLGNSMVKGKNVLSFPITPAPPTSLGLSLGALFMLYSVPPHPAAPPSRSLSIAHYLCLALRTFPFFHKFSCKL